MDQPLRPHHGCPSLIVSLFPQVSMASEALMSNAQVTKDCLRPSLSPSPTHGLQDVSWDPLPATLLLSLVLRPLLRLKTLNPGQGLYGGVPGFWPLIVCPVEGIKCTGITTCKCLEVRLSGNRSSPLRLTGSESRSAGVRPEMAG